MPLNCRSTFPGKIVAFQKRLALITIFYLSGQSLSGQDQIFQLIYPADHSRHWVNQIQVSGKANLRQAKSVTLNGTPARMDSTGRIDEILTLSDHKNILKIRVKTNTTVWDTTLTLWLMSPDHLDSDGRYVNHNLADSLWLTLISPQSGEMRRDFISFHGQTNPDATLNVNADSLRVYPSGGFTGLFAVSAGKNVYTFTASLNGETISDSIILMKPVPDLVQDVNEFSPGTALPLSDRWVSAGDVVPVGFSGKIGQEAYYQVPGRSEWQPLEESEPGVYTGKWWVLPSTPQQVLKIRYRVKNRHLFNSHTSSVAKIRFVSTPLGGLTTDEDSRIYQQLGEGLFMPLTDGIALTITGFQEGFYRIKLGTDLGGYIHQRDVKLLPQPLIDHPIPLGSMHGSNRGDWQEFRFYVGPVHPPFTFQEVYGPNHLELKLYGAEQGWEWTTFPQPEGDLAYLERRQPASHIWQMNFYSKKNQFWGWRGYYDGDDFVVAIRKPPVLKPDSLFSHIAIEIDPGHGGYERGAIGVSGYAEADADLRYSLKLAALLRAAGATVFLTRTTDTRLSLAERARIAARDSVHIFVMAHNNAPGSSTDPMTVSGTSTYFTWPSAKPLSDATYPHLLDMGLADFGKVTRYYYYLLRQTEYLVFLVEGGFMSHPEDEMFLLTEEGLDQLAQAVFDGIHDFLLEQSSR